MRIVVEINRHGRRPVDADDALQSVRLGRLLHQCVYFLSRGVAGRVEGEVDQGHVGGRHPDRGAVELALQCREYEPDRPRGAGRGRDQRQGSRPGAPQIAVQRVLEALVAGIGMDRRHVTALDADPLVQHIGDRSQAVGRARGVGDHFVLGLQLVVVDAHHDGHVGAVGGGRDDDPLGAGFEMLCRGFAPGEDAGAFERDIDPQFLPRQFRRVALGGDPDLAAAGVHPVLAGGDLAGKAAVHAVIAQQVRVGLDRPQIVDADDLDLPARVLQGRAHHQPPDPAESVDRYPYRHRLLL